MATHKMQGCHRVVNKLSSDCHLLTTLRLSGLYLRQCLRLSQVTTQTTFGMTTVKDPYLYIHWDTLPDKVKGVLYESCHSDNSFDNSSTTLRFVCIYLVQIQYVQSKGMVV